LVGSLKNECVCVCVCICMYVYIYIYTHTQGVPGGKVNILGGHSIGHSKQTITKMMTDTLMKLGRPDTSCACTYYIGQ